jgi:hypothetical protein
MELHLGRVTSRTVEAYRRGQVLLIPIQQLLDLAEVTSVRETNGDLSFTLQPGNVKGLLPATRDLIEIGRRTIPLSAEARLRTSGDDFISTEQLAQLFGTEFRVEWADLDVVAMDASVFPLGQRVARDNARRSFRGPRDENPEPDILMGLDRTSTGGAVVDYSLILPTQAPGTTGSWNLGVGADFFGGS